VNLDVQELVELVEPAAAELYLTAHGWAREQDNDMFSVWVRHDPPIHLFVPRSRQPDDYGRRLFDFVEKLARVELRDPAVVATNLRYAASDLVRIRLEGPNIRAGEVPIAEGADLFEGARKLMMAAACSAHDPKPYYGPRKPNVAAHYLEGVRLGQTERGSYVVTVISDIAPLAQETLLPEEAPAPFQRRVTETLASALGAAKEAARRVIEEFADFTVFEEGVSEGVSANLCDAIAYIAADESPTNIAVTVDFSASWLRVGAGDPIGVDFDPAEVQIVERAASHLRQLGPFAGIYVRGFVRHLDRGTADQVGTIIIEGVANGERRNVYVDLAGDAYRTAIAAHDERTEIAITGTLVKKGRHWSLLDPSDLEIVSGF
jgi:hypothetical protein